ncbi:MAG: HAD hydrolase family protein [Candidatus Korobacteraceae bacterium]
MPHPRPQDEKLAGANVPDAISFQGPIAALILDFDGVFTDNKVIVTDDGREAVICDRSDGYAIEQLKRTGLPILVLSTERVPIARFRCEKLGLECTHGVDDKAAALRQWLSAHNIAAQQTVYVGNDVNDIGCMQIVGHPVAVADAYPEAIAAARYVLAASGGHGAVREIALALAQHLRRTG